jgi:4-hydroxybenzoate polyprenyltransferase
MVDFNGQWKVSSTERTAAPPVLAVDLDGTLLKTDLLLESLLALLHQKLQYVFVLPLWLIRGKAYLKQQIARRVSLDVSVLPYRNEFLHYLERERAEGRSLVLATANDEQIARQVSDHLKLFDLVFASDGITNLSGKSKRDRLVAEFGEHGFDYAGDHRRDVVVWASARKAIVVGSNPYVRSSAARVAQVERVFEGRPKGPLDYLEALRPRHWLKNLLVFVPLCAAHRVHETDLLAKALLVFLAFGCFASSGYLLNDLLDLSADRYHPQKQFRPFAGGDLPLSYALVMIPVLFGLGCVLGRLLSPLCLEILLIYYALTVTYSLYVKKIVLLDVILLAGLYTLRIIAGSAAVGIWPSYWLLALSMFLFLSLALVKRYGELVIMRGLEGKQAKARGYELKDGELLAAMGTASGYLAVLVLALYISSGTAQVLYGRRELIWFLCPVLFYWISRVWLVAHRGRMHDDPLVFATKDPTSRILILLMLAIAILAV